MDDRIIAIVGALGGVLLGFLLNEISALLRQRGEDKRQLRRALFNLMNLHYLTSPLELRNASSMLHEWIQSKDPNVAKSFTTEQLRLYLHQFLESMITPLRQEAIQSLSASYEQTIENIATVDPLLAFSLSGRSRAQSDVRRYLSSVETLCGTAFSAAEVTGDQSAMFDAAREFYDTDLREVLENDIRAVGRRIGWITRFRVYRFMKQRRAMSNPELKGKLFALLDELQSRMGNTETR